MKTCKSISILLIMSLVQLSCDSRMKYLLKPNFRTSLQKQTTINSEWLFFNKPRINDEEFQYRLNIQFTNPERIPLNTFVNIKDTLQVLVNCRYFSPWTVFKGVILNVEGEIKILKRNKKNILYKQNIVVFDEYHKRKILFKGIRCYKIIKRKSGYSSM